MLAFKPYDYSEAEVKLFTKLGYSNMLQETSVTPPVLYRMAVEQAFLGCLIGPEIEALRIGAINVLWTGKIKRMTPEFDALITF